MRLTRATLFLVLLLTGCQFDPYADDLTIVKPHLEDVVGSYVYEKQTLTDTPSDNKLSGATITLYSDSTFSAIDVPDFEDDGRFIYNGVVNIKGKWKISSNGGVSNGSGGVNPIWGMDLTSLPGKLGHIEFMKNKPPYKLIITYGDPDEAAVMIFRKR